jgi:hypothetical protein
MAGGIFPNRPFAWNIKCIIFTILIAGGYWYLPPKNIYALFFLLWIPYIAMSWYDYAYDCRDKIQPTLFPYGRWVFLPFKPPGYKAEFEKLPKEQIATMNWLDHNLTWIILIAIIFYVLRTKKFI